MSIPKHLRPVLLAGWIAFLLVVAVGGQGITIPNSFVNNTAADANEVNANFAALADGAVNRAGGTMTGTLNTRTVLPTAASTYDLGSSASPYANIYSDHLVFAATQAASSNANTLDDYEEGAWTPVFGGGGGTSDQFYSVQTGRYEKVGKLVCVQGRNVFTAKGSITSSVQLQGLPFMAGGSIGLATIHVAYFANMGTNLLFMGAVVGQSQTTAIVYGTTAASTGGVTFLTTTDLTDTSELVFSGCYEAAA